MTPAALAAVPALIAAVIAAPAHAPPEAACAPSPDKMACIPGGPFLRGADTGPDRARPQQEVRVSTFYMDTHEVTHAQYQACFKVGRCARARPIYRDFDRPEQPMVGVSWFDSVQYCEAHGKHLPTEAEWEKAARGTDGRRYPWGDDKATCERAVIRDHRGRSCGIKKKGPKPDKGRTFVVGSRPAGVHGLFDMSGNSWEWVADWASHSYAACGQHCQGQDPKGPCDGAHTCKGHRYKIVRGGSWYWYADRATTTYRRIHVPSNKPYHHFGFRCAASVQEAAKLVAPQ